LPPRPATDHEADDFAGLSDIAMRPGWQRRAACRGTGTDLWFATDTEALEGARAICEPCPVRQVCLAYALASPELVGIWAGTDEAERRRMRRASA
jgi:WhiB family redox-sensing transcriptional regulator